MEEGFFPYIPPLRRKGESLKNLTRNLTLTAALSALAFVGMLLQISFGFIMPSFGFLKFDFSEAFCLIGGFVCGPLWGLLVVFIKTFLHFTLDGDWIGHSINFVSVGSMTLVASLFWQWAKNKPNKWTYVITGLIVAIITRIIVIIPTNWFFITNTFYSTFFPTKEALSAYLITVVPTFNSIQGLISSLVFIPLFTISQFIIKKEE